MEWISTTHELPPTGEWVLVKVIKKSKVFGPNVFVAIRGKYGYPNEWASAYGDGDIPDEIEIRYWSELPE